MIAFVARGELATARTGRLLMVTVIKSPLRFREVLDIDNPLGGVWHVTARSIHRWLLWKKVRSGSIKGSACPVHIEFRSLATVSTSGIHYIQEPESAAYLFCPYHAIQLIVW
jgi:hypothetical protein